MSKLAEMLGPAPDQSPYERGREDGRQGKPAPSFPTPDSTWSDRLYARGWSRGIELRKAPDQTSID